MGQIKNLVYNFIYSSFFKTIVKKITLFLFFFIDNEKGIPHFKFAPLNYGYSGVYLHKCRVTGNQTLLIALLFCLKVGMSKITKLTLTFDICDLFSKCYHKIKIFSIYL